ncbi:MAG: PilZ domain-containing protein [Thermodesulfobacteriota bacterium]|nr:PilZ domain-containing protein [Thermodesulfobacteriota bacterium]
MPESTNKSEDTNITTRLIKFIETLSTAQKKSLFNQLEEQQRIRRKNLRKHPRKITSVVSDYAVDDRVFKDFIQNISAGGVFIQTSSSFSVGQSITLTFSFPGYEEPIKVAGKIARKSSEGIGVKFSEMNKDLEAIL